MSHYDRIAVLMPTQPTPVRGGAERLTESIVRKLRERGYSADLIRVEVDERRWETLLEGYCKFFYLDLDSYDLVISTKAPSYMVRHRNHVSYLYHTVRVFYDMFHEISYDRESYRRRDIVHSLDKYGLSPRRVRRHFVLGSQVVKRLIEADSYWRSIPFEVLHPPSPLEGFREGDYKYVFIAGRLHRWKRIDLVARAMRHVKGDVQLLIAGDGEDRAAIEEVASRDRRIELLGEVSDEELLELYANALVVPFTPKWEDFGLVTVEAFMSRKPVITCIDSGEPTVLVRDGFSGFVSPPKPREIARRIRYFLKWPDEARRMGRNGYMTARKITWDRLISRLLGLEYTQHEERGVNVLVTDNQVLDPPVGGGRLRIYDLFRSMPPGFNVTYVGAFDWLGPGFRDQKLGDRLREICVPMTVPHIAVDSLISKACGGEVTLDVTTPFLMRLTPLFKRVLRYYADVCDVIVCSHPWVYPYIERRGKPLIYDAHNCEYYIKREILGRSLLGKLLAWLVRRIEKKLCQECDAILVCSEEDAELFQKAYGVSREKIHVIPNSVRTDVVKLTPLSRDEAKRDLGLSGSIVLFVGSPYGPNIEAAKFICERLAPEMEDCTFLVVGGISERHVGGKPGNVRFTGIVGFSRLMRIYEASDVAVNPVFRGSGSNVKMFWYMAAGVPVVTTKVGARGIRGENMKHFIVCEPEEFPRYIRLLLTDKRLYARIRQEARRLVEEAYDSRVVARRLGDIVLRLLGERGEDTSSVNLLA